MITEARAVGNALLGWPFRVEMNGYSPFLVQNCKLPGAEFEVVEIHGGGQTLAVKQAGGGKLTEWTLETIIPAAGAERIFWDTWRKQVLTRDVKAYYRDVTVTLLGPNDDPNMIWDNQDSWPSKIEVEEFKSDSKKDLAKIKVTLQCNDCVARAR